MPDKDPEVDPTLHYEENKHETPSQNPVVTEASQIIPKAAPYEFSSQHRDSAITRYKEKRKSRRYKYFLSNHLNIVTLWNFNRDLMFWFPRSLHF